MKPANLNTVIPFLFLLSVVPVAAEVLEDWQFNDAPGTNLPELANDAGSAVFTPEAAQVVTDGAGQLEFTQGADATDNLFRNAPLSTPDLGTGRYEMSFTYTAATLDGGDDGGANVGFSMRDDSNVDLFQVRLQRQGATLRLQHRVGTINTDLQNFGVTSLSNLTVRVVADLDTDTFDVFWTLGAGPQNCATNIPMAEAGLEFDIVRMVANTNTTDWGADDQVQVNFLTVATAGAATPLPLEFWSFDDLEGTGLPELANCPGTARFTGEKPQAVADGVGNLRFTVGEAENDNVFRNAHLTNPDQTTGQFEMAFTFTSATLEGGDATGANVGFGMRDEGEAKDLFVVRLQRQNSGLILQHRVGGTNTNLEIFGVTSLEGLAVRVVANLDTDTFDVHWALGEGPEKCMTNNPMSSADLEFDMVRLAANTNIVDWGETDEVTVGFLSVDTHVAPAIPPAIEDWQFDDPTVVSLDAVVNDVGTANLGAAADQVVTDTLGNLVFTQGADEADSVFRAATITNPDQTTGRFEMHWRVSSADIAGEDVTGANVGFGMRDTTDNVDLFLVRLQLQNGTLRLQHRVGITNTNLEDFGVTSLTDLLVRVVADLDTDTFSVFWQLGDGVGHCVPDIPMAETDLEFDAVRVISTTKSSVWGPDDVVEVDYLTIRSDVTPSSSDLMLSIENGPAAGQVTLSWPISGPEGAILESSPTLQDPWTEMTDTPEENDGNFELIIETTPGFMGYRLRQP